MQSLAALLCGALLAACVAPGGVDLSAGPADPSAEMRPDLIVSDPVRVVPGGIIALTFPEETPRGVLFVLEQRVGERWVHRYNLGADGAGGPDTGGTWHLPDDPNVALPAIGIVGPGPDRVPIPPMAEPGAWRICTGNAGDNFCAAITIEG